jgi:hypothetical protein
LPFDAILMHLSIRHLFFSGETGWPESSPDGAMMTSPSVRVNRSVLIIKWQEVSPVRCL